MSKQTSHRRSTLENRAARLGLVLAVSDNQLRMDALNNGEDMPVWQLSDGKHRSTIRGYRNLLHVAIALDQREAGWDPRG